MNKQTDELLDAVQSIAEIIYMEMPLREQDIWLKDIMNKGIWKPTWEMETEDKYDALVGACCRNGCEKCEQ
jgi:hypothetical protein